VLNNKVIKGKVNQLSSLSTINPRLFYKAL
jgi:hypothetical protein